MARRHAHVRVRPPGDVGTGGGRLRPGPAPGAVGTFVGAAAVAGVLFLSAAAAVAAPRWGNVAIGGEVT